jgi:hypothetical protein
VPAAFVIGVRGDWRYFRAFDELRNCRRRGERQLAEIVGEAFAVILGV